MITSHHVPGHDYTLMHTFQVHTSSMYAHVSGTHTHTHTRLTYLIILAVMIECVCVCVQAEKNRAAAAAAAATAAAAAANTVQKVQSGPRRLYVGSLHFNITKEMLRGIFEPFGRVTHTHTHTRTCSPVSPGVNCV